MATKLHKILNEKERKTLQAIQEIAERKAEGRAEEGDTQILKAVADECQKATEKDTEVRRNKNDSA